MPPWRVLYEVLSRMELTGAVRRGYFVEGLSGAQFALPEAVQLLQELTLPSTPGGTLPSTRGALPSTAGTPPSTPGALFPSLLLLHAASSASTRSAAAW